LDLGNATWLDTISSELVKGRGEEDERGDFRKDGHVYEECLEERVLSDYKRMDYE